jgi:hypothetical protein
VHSPLADEDDELLLELFEDELDDEEPDDEVEVLMVVPPPPPQAANALVESAEAPRNHRAFRRDGRADRIRSSRLPVSLWAGSWSW